MYSNASTCYVIYYYIDVNGIKELAEIYKSRSTTNDTKGKSLSDPRKMTVSTFAVITFTMLL